MGTLLNSWDNAPSLSGVIQYLAIWAGVAFAGNVLFENSHHRPNSLQLDV
jgi:hypothetical protein